MNSENDVKIRIITRAEEMFRQFGYQRVTMEEIAASLGISKKTLYKYFSNKEHILRELIDTTKCLIGDSIDKILCDPTLNFIERLNKFLNFLGTHSQNFNNPMMNDIMRMHPEIYQEIREFRKTRAYEKVSLLIEEGIRSGVIRQDIDKGIVVMVYVSAIHNIFVPDTFDIFGLQPKQAFHEIIKILFEGILSKDGRETYHNTINFKKDETGVTV